MPPSPPDQLIYARIADDLRARIDAGNLGGILPLPSDAALVQEYGVKFNGGRPVSRNSVRQALAILRDEGRIYTVKGRGSYVTPPMPSRHISTDRYDKELAAVLAGQTPDPADPTLPTADVSTVDADADLARLFDVPPGTRLVRRDWVTRIGGVPAQLTTSYLPADLALDLDAPLLRVGGGVIAYLVSVGVKPPMPVREVSAFRPASPVEAETFPTGVGWVVAITRQIRAGGRVVEVAREIVLPARNTTFENTTIVGG
jgi:GntR family transcriptional regulator